MFNLCDTCFHLYWFISLFLSLFLSVYRSIYRSVYLSVYLPVYLSYSLSFSLTYSRLAFIFVDIFDRGKELIIYVSGDNSFSDNHYRYEVQNKSSPYRPFASIEF